jgi:hypothetical protein
MAVDLDMGAPARDVLSVRWETIDDGRLARMGRYLWVLWRMVLVHPDAGDGGPRVPAFLVAVRRDTGEVLVRLRSDLRDTALMQYVQGQAETKTAGEFCEQWGVDGFLAGALR